ncbi:MAG: IclR family transcriptional regulator [Acidimicrobiia bacterium]
MADGPGLSSVRNAARILKAFTVDHKAYGVTELARALGLSTSTVHRLLTTLEIEHLIEKDHRIGKYRLGLAVYDLAAAVAPGFDLSEALLPPMTILRNRTGETVQVAVLDGRQVVYIERLDSPHTLRFFAEKQGRRNWAHCTSTGKVLLAFLAATDRERLFDGWILEPLTPRTITDLGKLTAELERVRDLGFAENNGESDLAVLSIGAPIRDATGQVIAALSLAGPVSRMEAERTSLRHSVTSAAAVASRRLGFEQHRTVGQ